MIKNTILMKNINQKSTVKFFFCIMKLIFCFKIILLYLYKILNRNIIDCKVNHKLFKIIYIAIALRIINIKKNAQTLRYK